MASSRRAHARSGRIAGFRRLLEETAALLDQTPQVSAEDESFDHDAERSERGIEPDPVDHHRSSTSFSELVHVSESAERTLDLLIHESRRPLESVIRLVIVNGIPKCVARQVTCSPSPI